MATATKREPKAGQTENKSALIREYVKAHRTATAKEISEKFELLGSPRPSCPKQTEG